VQSFSSQSDGQWTEDPITSILGLFNMQARSDIGPEGAIGGDVATDSSAAGNGNGGLGSADDKALRDMLYNVENLRKRPGAED
jgi:tRNA (guanine-N(7)-)-methyltransferase subunit TRM82